MTHDADIRDPAMLAYGGERHADTCRCRVHPVCRLRLPAPSERHVFVKKGAGAGVIERGLDAANADDLTLRDIEEREAWDEHTRERVEQMVAERARRAHFEHYVGSAATSMVVRASATDLPTALNIVKRVRELGCYMETMAMRDPAIGRRRGVMPYAWRHVWRWAFVDKTWHAKRRRLARWRALYWWIVRRYETEICAMCGGPVRLVFHVPDAIWEEVTGYGGRSPGGEAAPGVLCPSCVDGLARDAGLFLRWTCAADDSVLVG